MDAIRLKSEKELEFDRLRDRLDLEASHAAHHFDLLKGLDGSRTEYYREMNESNTFWHLTSIAHRDAVLSHLCRLYDQHDAALSLGRFLLTVKRNPNLFSEAAFQERLKDNPPVKTLFEAVDESELDRKLTSVSDSDPLVKSSIDLRDETISHMGADGVRKGTPEGWLPVQDIEGLLRRARKLTSKYSLLFRASQYGGIAGADDYKSTLRWVRKGLAFHQAEIEA